MIGSKETTEEVDKGESLKVIMDLQSLPEDLNIDQFFNIIKNSGIIVWDSTRGGKKPELVPESTLHLMDVGFIPREEFDEKFETLKEEQ